MANITKILNTMENMASPNRFYTQIEGVEKYPSDKGVSVLCKSVSIPENTRQEAEYWKNGIKYIIPREIGFSNELSITYYQDEILNLRGVFMRSLNANQKKNLNNEFNITVKVIQEKHNSKGTSDFTAVEYMNCFVKKVGGIELSVDSVEVPTFEVTFAFNWMSEVAPIKSEISGSASEPESKGLLASLGF